MARNENSDQMAEPTSRGPEHSGGLIPEAAAKVGQTVSDIAEGLGRFLGQAEVQWNSWKGQRDTVVQSLTAIRDRATELLKQVGETPLPWGQSGGKRLGRPPGSGRKRGRPAKAASASTQKRGPGRPKGSGKKAVKKAGRRTFTAAQKAQTSKRMKAYWAARRKEEGGAVGNG